MNIYKGSSIPLNITSAIILKDDRSFITYGKGSIEPDDEAKESFYNMAHGAKICLMQPGGFIEVYKKLKSEGTLMVLDMGWDENMSVENTQICLIRLISTHQTEKKRSELQERLTKTTQQTL